MYNLPDQGRTVNSCWLVGRLFGSSRATGLMWHGRWSAAPECVSIITRREGTYGTLAVH